MAEFRIETERLVLRDWQDGDWARFIAITNTPAVMRWLGGGVMDEAGAAAAQGRTLACQARHGHCFWLVERRADGGDLSGEVLGFCGLKRGDSPDSTFPGEFEIGWRLREDAWGKGYAREAAIASLDAAFGRFGARKVFATTVPGNTASWGLMERLGMQRREELDYRDGRYPPPLNTIIVYSLDAEAWTIRAS